MIIEELKSQRPDIPTKDNKALGMRLMPITDDERIIIIGIGSIYGLRLKALKKEVI